MSDLRALYQEVVLDHSKAPRNFHAMPGANRRAEGFNPLCGDQIEVFVKFDGDILADVSFLGTGCAISKASASLMTAGLKGKTRAEAEDLFGRFHRMLTGPARGSAATPAAPPTADPALGKLAVFSGVSEYPIRVKCATLPWHTLRAALAGQAEAVSTE